MNEQKIKERHKFRSSRSLVERKIPNHVCLVVETNLTLTLFPELNELDVAKILENTYD